MRLRFLPMRFSAELPARDELHGKPRPAAAGTGPGIGKSTRETAHSAQPSPANGVPEDMASLVIGNPGLNSGRNSGLGLGSGSQPVPNYAGRESAASGLERTDA